MNEDDLLNNREVKQVEKNEGDKKEQQEVKLSAEALEIEIGQKVDEFIQEGESAVKHANDSVELDEQSLDMVKNETGVDEGLAKLNDEAIALKQEHISEKNRKESLIGIDQAKDFTSMLRSRSFEVLKKEDYEKIDRIFKANGIQIKPENCPAYALLEEFTEKDWTIIRQSSTPELALHAASNFYNIKKHHEKRGRKSFSFEDKARLQSLPLVHGTTIESLTKIVETGKMISNASAYEDSNMDAFDFVDAKKGQTNFTDRQLGLDKYVFADFGRPHMYHGQNEITLVLSPEAMNTPGTFMTEKDIADCHGKNEIKEYLHQSATSEYFYQIAEYRISNTNIAEREVRRDGYYESEITYNNIEEFLSGTDGDKNNLGKPTFSTWEVKMPEVSVSLIKKVIVRDEEKFEVIKNKYGELFEVVLESDLKKNKNTALRLDGEFEKKYALLVEQDYQERMMQLGQLSDKERKVDIVVYPCSLFSEEEITTKTNPNNIGYGTSYDSMEQLKDEILNTDPNQRERSVSKYHKLIWFRDYYTTTNRPYIVAKVERARANPNLCRILELQKIIPSDFEKNR
ncbi:MAG: hypothetical protein WCK11_04925 [Candidatus Falkowbacteria bacterium]